MKKKPIIITTISILSLTTSLTIGYGLYNINTTINTTLDAIPRKPLLNTPPPTPTPQETTTIPTPAQTNNTQKLTPTQPKTTTKTQKKQTTNTKTTTPTKKTTTTTKNTKSNNGINILLLGSDARPNDTQSRSDSIMLLHLTTGLKQAYLISIPRDTYVKIPGYKQKNKINAAYAKGQTPLTAQTISNLLNTNIHHAIIIDFNGLTNLVNEINGITINNPYTGCDKAQNVCWKQGTQQLNGKQALEYSRWRKGLPGGDITRTENQRRILKAILEKALGETKNFNPTPLLKILNTTNQYITVDQNFTTTKMKQIITHTKITNTDEIIMTSLPIKKFTRNHAGAVDILDEKALKLLQQAIANDDITNYLQKYNKDEQ